MNADETILATEVKDIPFSYLGEFTRQLFDRICRDVRDRPKLSAKERSWFEGEVKTYVRSFEEVLTIDDERQQEVALRAVASALCLSYYHNGGPRMLREIKRGLTKAANDAWRKDEIKEIIERNARDRWIGNPELSNKPGKTALAIFNVVIKEVSNLTNIPDEWKVKNHENLTKYEKKRVIENIRGHIRRMKLLDE